MAELGNRIRLGKVGLDWIGLDLPKMDWVGPGRIGLGWIWLKCIGLGGVRLNWPGLGKFGFDWVGLDWANYPSNAALPFFPFFERLQHFIYLGLFLNLAGCLLDAVRLRDPVCSNATKHFFFGFGSASDIALLGCRTGRTAFAALFRKRRFLLSGRCSARF